MRCLDRKKGGKQLTEAQQLKRAEANQRRKLQAQRKDEMEKVSLYFKVKGD
jgi:hypothetical protein